MYVSASARYRSTLGMVLGGQDLIVFTALLGWRRANIERVEIGININFVVAPLFIKLNVLSSEVKSSTLASPRQRYSLALPLAS